MIWTNSPVSGMKINKKSLQNSISINNLCICSNLTIICLIVMSAVSGYDDQYSVIRDTSFYKTDSELWNYGRKLLKDRKISSGILYLDSIHRTGNNSPEFLSEYSKVIFKTFFPVKNATYYNRVNLNEMNAFLADTLSLSEFKFDITSSSMNSERKLPAFSYRSIFPVEKPLALLFNGLFPNKVISLSSKYEKGDPESAERLQFHMLDRSDSITCSIFIDMNNTKMPLGSYLKMRIDGLYDSIAIRPDLPKDHALSLRCYRWKNYSIDNGKFTAIISFDRSFEDKSNEEKSGKKEMASLRVRYTVIVQSPGCVRDLAEAKLQAVLKLF